MFSHLVTFFLSPAVLYCAVPPVRYCAVNNEQTQHRPELERELDAVCVCVCVCVYELRREGWLVVSRARGTVYSFRC